MQFYAVVTTLRLQGQPGWWPRIGFSRVVAQQRQAPHPESTARAGAAAPPDSARLSSAQEAHEGQPPASHLQLRDQHREHHEMCYPEQFTK